MLTNTPAQQASRRASRAQNAARLAAEIEAGYQEQRAYLAERQRRVTLIAEMRAAGATEAEILHAQDAWYH